MDELNDMDLGDTTEADGPQIHLERWVATLENESCSEVLKFARTLEEIRGNTQSNGVFQAIIEALRTSKRSLKPA